MGKLWIKLKAKNLWRFYLFFCLLLSIFMSMRRWQLGVWVEMKRRQNPKSNHLRHFFLYRIQSKKLGLRKMSESLIIIIVISYHHHISVVNFLKHKHFSIFHPTHSHRWGKSSSLNSFHRLKLIKMCSQFRRQIWEWSFIIPVHFAMWGKLLRYFY